MRVAEHEKYAKRLLASISDAQPETGGGVAFTPNRTQSRNAAHAMTAILCHRLFKASGEQPKRIRSSTYAWAEGVLNNRNIADRDHLWSNMRREVADAIHQDATKQPVAYLLAFSNPSNARLCTWAVPESLLYDSLSRLPLKAGGEEYTIQIFANKQRIAHDPASPDLSSYFADFPLSHHELRVLEESRDIDALVRKERAIATGQSKKLIQDLNNIDHNSSIDGTTKKALIDARLGQGKFRARVLRAWGNCCSVTGSSIQPGIRASHIKAWRE